MDPSTIFIFSFDSLVAFHFCLSTSSYVLAMSVRDVIFILFGRGRFLYGKGGW